MSYTDARTELVERIDHTLETRDIEGAYLLAYGFNEVGDDEHAEYWRLLATKWSNEDWAHDRNKD